MGKANISINKETLIGPPPIPSRLARNPRIRPQKQYQKFFSVEIWASHIWYKRKQTVKLQWSKRSESSVPDFHSEKTIAAD